MSAANTEALIDQLHQLFTTMRRHVFAVLRPLDLAFSQYVCLQMLQAAPYQSNAELARAMRISPQAMNRALQELQREGLIDRPVGVSSGRARPAALTAHGRRILKQADVALQVVEQQQLSGLSDAQCNGLRAALRVLADQDHNTIAPAISSDMAAAQLRRLTRAST